MDYSNSSTELSKPHNKFGPYEIISQIGVGGMGKVYKARDTELDRIVALKVMLSDESASEKDKQRFISEAQLMAKLEHDNIVRVFNAGQHEGKSFIAMDFVAGEPLSKLIKNKSITFKQCLNIMVQICTAMGYAHEKNIIHRDLKPSNIMITKDHHALVMDFGLAKSVEGGKRLTKSGELLGTPQYMSPEQAEGETRKFRPATDVYALGAIMYEMLTGKPVVDGHSTYNIIFAIINNEVIPPRQIKPNVGHDLETICLKALEKESNRRYEHAGLLAEDIQRYLNGEIIEARRASLVYRWRKKILSNKWLIAGSIIFLTTAVSLYQFLKEDEQRKQQQQKEKKWATWWENFIKVSEQNDHRITLYQEKMEQSLTNLQSLYTHFQKWQQLGKRDLKSDSGKSARSEWGKAEDLYQSQKQQLIDLRTQEKNTSSVINNLTQLANRYEDLSRQIPAIESIAKKMENKFLGIISNDLQESYRANAQQVENYNPAQIAQNAIYETYLKKYIEKNMPLASNSDLSTETLIALLEKNQDLSIFEQQKILLNYILLIDPSLTMVMRYHKNFSPLSILEYLQQISHAQYLSIMEQIIQNQSPSLETLDRFRHKLHEVCMMNPDFSLPYYRIARLLQQISGRHYTANWYFQKSIAKNKQSDFFTLYFQLNSLYEIFITEILTGHATFGLYKKNRAQFRASQNAFNKIPIGPAQKDYQKLNQVYEDVWNYIEQFFQPGSPIYNGKYFGNKKLTDQTKIAIAGRWYNLPFCPPGSEDSDTKTFDSGIVMYLRMLKKLNEIEDDNLATTVALRKAQVYEDLARLTHLRSWNLINIPPDLEEVKNSISSDQIYINYHKVLEQDNFEVAALKGLAKSYALLGDFIVAEKFYKRLKDIRPSFAGQYTACLLNLPPNLANTETIEIVTQWKQGSKPRHLGQFRDITTMTAIDGNFDYEKQMALHSLAFAYSALGEKEKLTQVKKFLFPVKPKKAYTYTEIAISAYTGLVYAMLAIQAGDLAKAENCTHIVWDALKSQHHDVGSATRIGNLILPYLKHYRNPFLAPHRYQVMPKGLAKMAQKMGQNQKNLNSNFSNHIGVINQTLYFLEKNPKVYQQFEKMMKKVTGVNGSVYTILYYLSNKSIDLMEIHLEKTSIAASPATIYRRAILFFRKFLQLRAEKKSPEQQKKYLKQIVYSLQSAVYQQPSQSEYHYSLAVVASYLSKSESSYTNLALKHLHYAVDLGMKNRSLVIQEPAFSHLKRNSSWRKIIQLMQTKRASLEEKPFSLSQKNIERFYQKHQLKDVLLQTRLLNQKTTNQTSEDECRALLHLKDSWQNEFSQNEKAIKQRIDVMFNRKESKKIIDFLKKN